MFRKKIITREDGTPYLIRRYIIKTKLFQVCIHKILQSDPDCLHDHPWNFISFILRGGYWEGTTPEQRLDGFELEYFKSTYKEGVVYYRWFGWLSILKRNAEWKHRLKLPKHINTKISSHKTYKEEPCTTLVIMFRKKREWGFFTKAGWIPWFKYKPTSSCE
jgi:hypothetical protein